MSDTAQKRASCAVHFVSGYHVTFSTMEPSTVNDRNDNTSGTEEEHVAPRGSAQDMSQQEAGTRADENEMNGQDIRGDMNSQIESTEYVVDGIVDN